MKHFPRATRTGNENKRWSRSDIFEFCMLYPEINDVYEWADFFGRSPIAIRAIMVRHAKLVSLGGDPTTVRFVEAMANIKVNRVLWDKDFGNPFVGVSVYDKCQPIKPRF